MGSDCESNPTKPHYDIALSKRTRKPSNLQQEVESIPRKEGSPEKESPEFDVKKEEEKPSDELGDQESAADHKSLNQLIKGSSSSLGQHFTQEKQLPLVVKQHVEDLDGVKFKTLVSRYARVLSRLIKIKRDARLGSRKKQALRLSA